MDGSRVFVDGMLEGQVALVTGGGTNLGKAAAAELARCGASVVIAGRRAGRARGGCRRTRRAVLVGRRRHPRPRRRREHRPCLARAPRPAGFRAEQRRRPVLRPGRGDHHQGLASRPAPQRRRHAGDVRGGLRARDAPGRVRHDRQRDRLAAPRDARDGAHRRGAGGGRGDHPRARRVLGRRRRRGGRRSRSGGSRPSRCASTRPSCGATAAKTVPLQRLGEVDEYGWLVALLASPLGRSFSGSVVTLDGALDNWTGPWPPRGPHQGRRGADRGAPAA